jgi:hypothetical protein
MAFDVLFKQGSLLQILTAGAVILAALLLRILDQIGSEAAISVLSGTAGYVLGGISKREARVPSDP